MDAPWVVATVDEMVERDASYENLFLAAALLSLVGQQAHAILRAEAARGEGLQPRWFSIPELDGLRRSYPERFEVLAEGKVDPMGYSTFPMGSKRSSGPRLAAMAGSLEGRVFEIDELHFSIGRHSDSRLQIRQVSVSRHQCVFEEEGGGWASRDLESRHGTSGELTELELVRGAGVLHLGELLAG